MSNPPGKIRLDAEQLKWPDFLTPRGEEPTLGEGLFRQVFAALPAAVYITDAGGVITYYNEAAATLWGQRPVLGKSQWCGSWKLYWPDGRPLPHDQCPMAIALRERRPNHGQEAVAERPDGLRVPFMPYATPLYDESGMFVGAVNMLVDLSDREHAELSAQRLAAIVEHSDDAIVSKDLNGIINTWNRGAERLFGYTAEEAIGKPIAMLIPAERQDEEPAILERIRRGELIDHYETVRKRKDGSLIHISLTTSPIKNAAGVIVGASKIARDISERRRAYEQQVLLVKEIKHRIKNTMAIVQAIARQTLRAISDSDRDAFLARLQALAGAHDLLTVENWSQASLRDVVGRALEPFRETHSDQVSIEGPDGVRLDAQKSCLVSMALHELATNAVKYGALSNASGRVRVTWEALAEERGEKRFRLFWEERGGPPVEPPVRHGFGSLLIQHALDGERHKASLDFAPEGVTCTLELAC